MIRTKRSSKRTKKLKKIDAVEPPWLYGGVPFTEDQIGDFEGFVYLILHKETGRRYIGRKYFYNVVRKKKTDRRRTRKESDWKTYWGSSTRLKSDIEKNGASEYERHILSLHLTRGDTNFTELRYQFAHVSLIDGRWYNDAIGKYRTQTQRIVDGRAIAKNFGDLLG